MTWGEGGGGRQALSHRWKNGGGTEVGDGREDRRRGGGGGGDGGVRKTKMQQETRIRTLAGEDGQGWQGAESLRRGGGRESRAQAGVMEGKMTAGREGRGKGTEMAGRGGRGMGRGRQGQGKGVPVGEYHVLWKSGYDALGCSGRGGAR